MDNPAARPTQVERRSDRELAVTRRFTAPAHLLYRAWSEQELFRQWWVPRSFGLTLLACELDVRIGGGYRLEYGHPASEQPMAFFGKYLEVIPDAKLVWTNEESPDGAVTTVTFEAAGDQTVVTVCELYPSKEALEAELEHGAGIEALPETLGQLETLVAEMTKS